MRTEPSTTGALLRIMYVMPTFATGGTERIVSDQVQHLDPERFEASVCVFENGLLGQALASRGYTVHCLGSRDRSSGATVTRVGALARRAATLRRILAAGHIDVVHTHFLGPALHAYVASFPARRWAWVHTEHVRPDATAGYPGWLRRSGWWLMRSADVVTGVSDDVAGYIRERAGVPPARVRFIANGIDVDLFARPYDRNAKRREIGVPSDAWVIGTVGNLRAQKNHELALRALARLLREAPESWLVLAGDGERRGRLEGLARELGVKDRTLFLGARMDVPELFGAFDVYCLPSHFEGMPLSVLEAMAARTPVVGTKVAGIQDLIVDGVTGLLTAPDDVEALSRTLLRLYRDRALGDRLVEAGWHHVDTHARVGTMVHQYADLYEELAGACRRRG